MMSDGTCPHWCRLVENIEIQDGQHPVCMMTEKLISIKHDAYMCSFAEIFEELNRQMMEGWKE